MGLSHLNSIEPLIFHKTDNREVMFSYSPILLIELSTKSHLMTRFLNNTENKNI